MNKNEWSENVIQVLNIIDGRRLWEASDGNLCTYALAKAESIPSANGTHTAVNQDIKIVFPEDTGIEELEKSITQAEEALKRGKELLRDAREYKLEEAISALTRVTGTSEEEVLQALLRTV